MKHSINFYLDDLKPKVHYLTLRNTLLASLACAIGIFAWKLVLDSEIKQSKQRVNAVQSQLNLSQMNLERLQIELVKHNDKATFNQRKQRLEESLNAKRMLWEGVGKGLEATTVNYHSALDQLTKFHEDNIWLTSFQVSEGQMAFGGYSLESSAVTRWMTQLQSSSVFKGREFSLVNIKAHDRNSLTFVIATSAQVSETLSVLAPAEANTASAPQLPEVSINE